MYLEFYGLKEPPFSITPDPRFVFLSERHRDALAHLLYGVGKGGSGGFVLLTGEVGTGKTTLSRLLLEQLPENTRIALVLNPKLSPVELLETVGEELKLDIGAVRGSVKGLVDTLNHFLLDAYAQGLRIVLIIDEAQNLSAEALEQVRLLTNLETPTQKLLQIILLGQPELRTVLARPELRQLAQRVTARYHLTPLDEDETESYLRHRIGVAGAARFPFSRLAVRALHRRANGVPRVINGIADRALMAGYVADQPAIGETLVEHAADEVIGQRPRRVRQLVFATLAFAIAGAALAAYALRVPPAPVAIPTAPAPSAPEPPAMLDRAALAQLIGSLPADGGYAAWSNLLAMWKADARRVVVRDAARCPRDIGHGLSCLSLAGAAARIEALDRPVIVRLRGADSSADAVMLQLGSESVHLDFGARVERVERAAFDALWPGEFFALWRTPTRLPETVRLGDTGPAVTWIALQLAAFDKLPGNELGPAYYDSVLEARVRRVQGQFGLVPDGIVGPETQLVLATRDAGGPRLLATD
jgi:general secretion pathway protein A